MKSGLMLLLSVAALACRDVPPTTPDIAPTPFVPAFSYENGPDDLPNVIRFETGFAFGIQDPGTNLVVWAGLAENPMTTVGCPGGTEPLNTAWRHTIGLLQEAIKQVVVDGSIRIHVYDRATFIGPCRSTPFATGRGHASYTDNDVDPFASQHPGINSWGFRINGPVVMSDGSTAQLSAHNRFQFSDDGGTRLVSRRVSLSGP